jgi:hypothetical protein
MSGISPINHNIYNKGKYMDESKIKHNEGGEVDQLVNMIFGPNFALKFDIPDEVKQQMKPILESSLHQRKFPYSDL